MTIKADQLNAYKKDMYKFERIGETLKEAKYPKIFKVNPKATGAGDKFTQKLSAGELERHAVEGQEIAFNSVVEGWTSWVKYHTYSAGLTFTYEAVKDVIKMTNMLKDYANTWGDEVRRAKEMLAARVFNEGGNLLGDFVFNGSYTGESSLYGDMPYDNEPFFNLVGNTNSTKGGGTYYNSVASAYAAGAILPSHISTLYNLMTATNNRDELDRPTENKPDTVLCKPGADYDSLWTIFNSDLISNSQLNDKNVHKGRIKQIIEWDYLDEAAVYMGKAQSDLLTFDERQIPEIDFFEWKKTRGYLASIMVRFGVHVKPGSRRLWVRGGGTSA